MKYFVGIPQGREVWYQMESNAEVSPQISAYNQQVTIVLVPIDSK